MRNAQFIILSNKYNNAPYLIAPNKVYLRAEHQLSKDKLYTPELNMKKKKKNGRENNYT